MDIIETARIKLVIDGAEVGKNELSKITEEMAALTKKRDEYTKGSKEWKHYNDLIKEQARLYKTVEERMDVMKMTLPQLVSYQKDLAKAIGQGNTEAAERIKDVNTRIAEMKGAIRATHDEVPKGETIWSKAKGWIVGAFSVAAIMGFINKVVDLGKQIFEITGRFEKYGNILKNTLGGQQEAAAAMEMIKDLAKTTPVGVDEMTSSFIKMVNRGLQPTSTELKQLADLAASQGKSFDQLTEAVLDAMMAEGERLKEFGIKMKKEGDNISLMFKGQTVTVKNNEQAIYDAIVAMGAYQGVAGVTGDVSAGLEGRLSNLGDAWDFLLVAIGEKIKPLFQWLLKTLAEIVDWIGNNIHLMDPYLAVWNNLREALQMVWGVFTDLLSVFKIGEKSIFTLENTVKVISTAFANFGTIIKVVITIVQGIIDSFIVLASAGRLAFKFLKGDFDGAANDAAALAMSWNKLKENASKNFDSITGVYKKIWASNKDGLVEATTQVDMYGKMFKNTEDKNSAATEEGSKKRNEARKKEIKEAEKLEKEWHEKFLNYEKERLQAEGQTEKERQKKNSETTKLIADGLELVKKLREKHSAEAADRQQLDTNQINEFYKKQQADLLEDLKFKALSKQEAMDKDHWAQEIYKTKYTKLTKEQQEAVDKIVEDSTKKRQKLIEDSFMLINAVADAAMSIYGAIMSDKMDEANTNTERALLENQEMWVQWGTQATSVVQAWMKDWVSGLAATVAWAGQGIANLFTAGKRKRQAEMEDLRVFYETQINTWKDFIENADDDLKKYFGQFMDLTDAAVEYTEAMANYDPKFIIDNEIKRAAQIIDTYEKAAGLEKKNHDDRISNINAQHDQEVKRINDIYDLRQRLADQEFSVASNAIRQAQANSLLGLISNQETKDSLTGEYAGRLQRIKEIFSLADQEIVDGMSQAEVSAINEAREAREAAMGELEQWYISELEFAVTSEGQKRKVYSETEKIRNEAEEALDKLKMEKTAADIKRNQEKNNELMTAEKDKNEKLAAEEERHSAVITKITFDRDAAIKASWELVKSAILRGYDEIIAAAEYAFTKGAITLDQYRALVNEAEKLKGNLDPGKAFSDPGTENAYQEWRAVNNKPDNDGTRIEYVLKDMNWFGGYAEGTEYLQRGIHPPGVDTIPIMANEGERIISTPDNQEIGDYSNKEVVAIVKNHRRLEQLAVAGVTARSQGLIRSFQTSAIAQTGMPAYSRPVSTAPPGGISYNLDTSTLERQLAAVNEKLELLQLLSELPELLKVSEDIRNKPVLSLEKLQREAAADSLNQERSTFG